ncbi:MAG: hemolysin family protein [Mariprofundales bacterium]|nr:hemolysin family protein [Mariprofundales bacterium]
MNQPLTAKLTIQQRLRHWLLQTLRPGETHEELLEVINRASAIRSDKQREMLEHIIEIDDTRMREVMTPRSEIIAVQQSMSCDEALELMVQYSISRAPLIDNDLDHIIGILHIWDLLRQQREAKEQEIELKKLATPYQDVAELQRVSSVLHQMKTNIHLAIVRDEYDGVAGLVTLSDLLSEIVGPLTDNQHTPPRDECICCEDGRWSVLTRMHLEEFEEVLGIDLPDGDFDTVGGLILSQLQRIPRTGERVKLAGLDIEIVEADPRRVIRVLIRPLQAD